MRKAVMYGAGNIGRGFIGKALSESGYEVCFVDIAEDIVNKLNEDKQYPVRIVSNETRFEVTVQNVSAVNGKDTPKVADLIAGADILATAVGVGALPGIIKPLCAGLKKRFESTTKPLSMIICENLMDADKALRQMIEDEMGPEYSEVLSAKLGLVQSSIGRMVPVMTDDMREGNLLRVWVEPYDELPVDKDAFVGGLPDIKGLVPYAPFDYYVKRKLYIHNMGHALCAYHGQQKGYVYIYQCVEDETIRQSVRAAMLESAVALRKEYGASMSELETHIDDLISRFANRALMDTVARVGKDPLRKLNSNDRLVGAALYCRRMKVEPKNIIDGIAAGLHFRDESDDAAVKMQKQIMQNGAAAFLREGCGLADESLINAILERYSQK